jgi:hypothetical protein
MRAARRYLRELDRVNGAVGIAVMVLDDLEYSWALALPWFGRGMLAAKLGDPEGVSHLGFCRFRKLHKVSL